MCGLSSSETIIENGTASVTTTMDSLRTEVRDKSTVAVDARRPDDYKRAHIPGAVNLPLARLLEDDSPETVAKIAGSLGIGDETRLVVYDDTFGAIASRIAWALEHTGHENVTLLDSVFSQWDALGLETDSKTPDVSACEHAVSARPEIIATHDYLEGRMGNDDDDDDDSVVLIDNRERLNFLEQHIPGAISLPYRMLASDDHILRGGHDMRRLLENRGVLQDSEIITYCGSVGTLSGLGYYALRSAGFTNVRLYVRSFREWKNLQKPTVQQPDANYWDLSAE